MGAGVFELSNLGQASVVDARSRCL